MLSDLFFNRLLNTEFKHYQPDATVENVENFVETYGQAVKF